MDTAIAYPRSWHARSLVIVDPRDSADTQRLIFLRGKRQQMARSVQRSILRWSPARNLLWHVRDQWANAELAELGFAVLGNRRTGFIHHGPPNAEHGAALEQEIAALWMRCSLQMHHLARGNRTSYLHVLQPSQYVPDSKPLSEFERTRCFEDGQLTIGAVRRLYPLLQEQGRHLVGLGVEFSDQTMVFSGVTDSLYVDSLCHFNEKGNQILCDAIADQVLAILDRAASD